MTSTKMEKPFKVLLNGIKLNAYHHQAQNPRSEYIILAHGHGDDSLCWNPLVRLLSKNRYSVIAYDARGHGYSDAPTFGYTYEALADDLIKLIEHFKLHQPLLIGHSMGAATIAYVAGAKPELVSGIILEDPPPPFGEGKQQADDDPSSFLNLRRLSLKDLIKYRLKKSPRWSAEDIKLWAESTRLCSPLTVQRHDSKDTNWINILGRIKCRTLLITGDSDHGALITLKMSNILCKMVANSSCNNIVGAGHNIRRDCPQEYWSGVAQFLEGDFC